MLASHQLTSNNLRSPSSSSKAKPPFLTAGVVALIILMVSGAATLCWVLAPQLTLALLWVLKLVNSLWYVERGITSIKSCCATGSPRLVTLTHTTQMIHPSIPRQAYSQSLEERPMMTKAATALVGCALGDLLAQVRYVPFLVDLLAQVRYVP